MSHLETDIGPTELLEASVIGPSIGAELKEQSFWIIAMVTIALLIYISLRFEWIYGLAALLAVVTL